MEKSQWLPNFSNPVFLQEALTHSSYVNEHPGHGRHNERLEFLGDSILKYVLTKHVYSQNPNIREGVMTVLRAEKEQNITLAKVALSVGLDKRLRLGRGTNLQKGRQSIKILSGALEALIGAYHEDSGLDAVENYIIQLLPLMQE